jgi:excisionase family DNA binding protein
MKTDNKGLLTVKELAADLRVHFATIYRRLKLGEFLAFRIGHGWRFDIETVIADISSLTA